MDDGYLIQPSFPSTHPVWGRGLYIVSLIANALIFQSTHPVWGGTYRERSFSSVDSHISIHPPRVGWDSGNFQKSPSLIFYFNPPTPCGVGRSVPLGRGTSLFYFNPTHPVWGGTENRRGWGLKLWVISMHPPPPVWGGTNREREKLLDKADFDPPAPCGVGPAALAELLRK